MPKESYRYWVSVPADGTMIDWLVVRDTVMQCINGGGK